MWHYVIRLGFLATRDWFPLSVSTALLLTAGLTARPSSALAQRAPSTAAPSRPALVAKTSGVPVKSRSTLAVDSFADESPTQETSGFRMEGAPQLEVVFGDIAHFKATIDRYRELHSQMQASHARFASATHSVQQLLAGARKARRICPADAIATSFAQASESGLVFRRLGEDLETTFHAIRQLDELGESAGLTPDYRWHVRSSKRLYKRALIDLREMRATFKSQVEAEARAHGCNSETLLARAEELRSLPEDDAAESAATPDQSGDAVVSSTATFFVNNQSCGDAVRVYVDNTLLGEVAAKSRSAFQSLSGRHSLCILAADDTRSCGDAETVRTAFVHDGFTMSRSCAGD